MSTNEKFHQIAANVVYVGNLPLNTTDDELADLFSQCGKIQSICFLWNKIPHCNIKIAYIRFQQQSHAQKALSLHRAEYRRSFLIVVKLGLPYRFYVLNYETCVKVSNFGDNIELWDLYEEFKTCGSVSLVLKTTNSFAFVNFDQPRYAYRALTKRDINGSDIKVFSMKNHNGGRNINLLLVDIHDDNMESVKAILLNNRALDKGPTKSLDDDDKTTEVSTLRKIGVLGMSSVMDPNVMKNKIHTIFSRFGKIRKIKMIIDRVTSKSKGYCFITFEDHQSAKSAYNAFKRKEIDGLNAFNRIDGRSSVRVDFAKNR